MLSEQASSVEKEPKISDNLEQVVEDSRNGKNCNNCQYVKSLEQGSVECHKNISSGIVIKLNFYQASIDCPAHSEYNRIESRYGRGNIRIFDSEDTCNECHRTIKNASKYKIKAKARDRACVLCNNKD